MRIKLVGKCWKLRFDRIRKKMDGAELDGYCDHPKVPSKEIVVDKRLKGLSRLETIIHELSHGCWPHLSEDAVEESSRDIARVLWRLGYRDGENHSHLARR